MCGERLRGCVNMIEKDESLHGQRCAAAAASTRGGCVVGGSRWTAAGGIYVDAGDGLPTMPVVRLVKPWTVV